MTHLFMSKSWFWMWGPQWLAWEKRLFFSLDSSSFLYSRDPRNIAFLFMFCFLLIVWASFLLFWKQEGIKTSLLPVIKLVLCQLTVFFPSPKGPFILSFFPSRPCGELKSLGILILWVRTHGCLTWILCKLDFNLRRLIVNHSIGWCLTKGWLLSFIYTWNVIMFSGLMVPISSCISSYMCKKNYSKKVIISIPSQ